MKLYAILNHDDDNSACSSPLSSPPTSPISSPAAPSSPVPSSPESVLSELSRSPSPVVMPAALRSQSHFPTPPPSQTSGYATPRSYDDSNCSSSTERDDRPSKRRCTDDQMSRRTRYLDLGRLDFDTSDEQQPQLAQLLKGLRKKRRIVVVAGAGISVSAGIPDFRSANGIFRSIKEEYNLKGSGKDLFDASVYRDNDTTSTFHHMVRQMSAMTKIAKPTPFHDLLARLAHEGRLLRLYTQNIDGLDTSLEPLKTQIPLPKKGPWPKCIQLHGGLDKMQCSKCGELADFDAAKFDGPVPPACSSCLQMDHVRTVQAGKRSHGIGRMRPRMVLYQESSPDEDAIGAVSIADLKARPDAIIVVGTSMKIPGVRRIVKEMCALVRDRKDSLAVWINNDPEPAGKDFSWDVVVKGSSDRVAELAGLGKWDDPEETCQAASAEQIAELPSSQPSVVINTPRKAASLPTPEYSPSLLSRVKMETQSGTEHIKNPASRGTTLKTVLGESKKTAAASKPKNASHANGSKQKRGQKASNPVPPTANTTRSIKLHFNTTKALVAEPAKAAKSSSSSTPKKAKQDPMSELHEGSPKTNTSPPYNPQTVDLGKIAAASP